MAGAIWRNRWHAEHPSTTNGIQLDSSLIGLQTPVAESGDLAAAHSKSFTTPRASESRSRRIVHQTGVWQYREPVEVEARVLLHPLSNERPIPGIGITSAQGWPFSDSSSEGGARDEPLPPAFLQICSGRRSASRSLAGRFLFQINSRYRALPACVATEKLASARLARCAARAKASDVAALRETSGCDEPGEVRDKNRSANEDARDGWHN